jgi:glucose/arabinose dehydrogenase
MIRRRSRGSCCWIATCALALWTGADARADGPLPERIPLGTAAVELVDFVQVPPSSGIRPRARINGLTHAGDGSGRLFVNDMRGRIWLIQDGAIRAEPFLDAAAALGGALDTRPVQRGLVGFAFHPDYAKSGAPGWGRLYTTTSETPGSAAPDFAHPLDRVDHLGVLSEWSVDPADPDRVDPRSRRVLLRTAQPSGDHTLSQIGFDPFVDEAHPDYGMLYLALGDGGGYDPRLGQPVDPERVAQDTSNPFGAILRIDPLGASTPDHPTNGAYGIPEDNPFAGRTDAAEEIWAYGLRNPHRFAWDPGGRGHLFISDIGQSQIEEIDLGARGANYGWSEREGTTVLDPFDPTRFLPLPPGDASLDLRYPVAQYDHDEGFAIVGGFVLRGGLVPSLEGRYLFGDNNGRLFHAAVAELTRRALPSLRVGRVLARRAPIEELRIFHRGVETSLLEILNEPRRADVRFGTDEQGRLYVLTKRDGMVRALRALACDDGRDDDGDGYVDLRDPECAGADDPSEACGLGFELGLLLPPLAWLRARRRAQTVSPRPIRSTKLS